MAYYRDRLVEDQTWIDELARADIHPEAERLLQLGKNYDPHQLVEESAVDFLSELRDLFSEYARIFNSYSEQGTKFQEVKIYSVAQTPCDFMIFRNQIKLLVSSASHGVIQIGFDRHVQAALSVDGTRGDPNQFQFGKAEELIAQVGPFRDVYWTYAGEKVSADAVAKFYFTEFIRTSRDQKKSKLGSQMLVEQIKSLLKEKGLDF
jgi:hypothetical protein